jgi:hypothetical protein
VRVTVLEGEVERVGFGATVMGVEEEKAGMVTEPGRGW